MQLPWYNIKCKSYECDLKESKNIPESGLLWKSVDFNILDCISRKLPLKWAIFLNLNFDELNIQNCKRNRLFDSILAFM